MASDGAFEIFLTSYGKEWCARMGQATVGTIESGPVASSRLLPLLMNSLGLGLLSCFLHYIFSLFQQDQKKEDFDEQDLTTWLY
jgi:hypothetical protein